MSAIGVASDISDQMIVASIALLREFFSLLCGSNRSPSKTKTCDEKVFRKMRENCKDKVQIRKFA